MRIQPLNPDALSPEARYVHNEIANLIGHSQSQVKMINDEGALLGPFTPMLKYPQFGIAALSFLRTLDTHATLDKALREVAILTVGGAYGSKFILYAHQIMADVFGIAPDTITKLAAGGRPEGLTEQEMIANDIAHTLVNRGIVPDAMYREAVGLLGEAGVAELFFLVSGYSVIATILNGFDIPAPNNN